MENIRLAFQGIWGHKMRSFLTMLGIIIGIASIITIVSTIKGTNEQIKENLIGSGSNVVTVSLYQDDWEYDMTYSPLPEGVRVIEDSLRDTLNRLSGVEEVSFFTRRYSSDFVSAGANRFSGETYGIDSAFFRVNSYQVTYGRDFDQRDYDGFRKVAIVDKKAAAALFGTELPIGKVLEIKGEPFTVVGVAEQTSTFEPAISSYNDYYMYADTSAGAIFLPSAVWPMVFYFDEPQSVAVKATSTDTMTRAGQAVADILNESQLISTGTVTDEESGDDVTNSGNYTGAFSYRSQDLLQQAQQLQEMSNSTNQQLIWIASISLLVGGIGVMNIMLVSVTERTSEIGLKKALGAKKKRIRRQFLTEAAVLTSLGGIIGVVLGIIFAHLISASNGVPVAIDIPATIISVVFSMAIGIVFGMLPAVKAANLNPIEALRRE
ncbi:MAG: ABC transporter permease [Oscillospiraceae bacterium]|nr:ABC transporter permease [Oscillospiraceae bacterium]